MNRIGIHVLCRWVSICLASDTLDTEDSLDCLVLQPLGQTLHLGQQSQPHRSGHPRRLPIPIFLPSLTILLPVIWLLSPRRAHIVEKLTDVCIVVEGIETKTFQVLRILWLDFSESVEVHLAHAKLGMIPLPLGTQEQVVLETQRRLVQSDVLLGHGLLTFLSLANHVDHRKLLSCRAKLCSTDRPYAS